MNIENLAVKDFSANQEAFNNFMKNMSMFNQIMGMMGKGSDETQKNIFTFPNISNIPNILPQLKEKEEILSVSQSNAKTPQNIENSNNLINKKITRERKISSGNLTDEEENVNLNSNINNSDYIEKLKNIFSQVEVNEVVTKLLSKLTLKDPCYEMILADHKLGKWKCSVKINYGGNDMFQGTGFHNKKKKAKSNKI